MSKIYWMVIGKWAFIVMFSCQANPTSWDCKLNAEHCSLFAFSACGRKIDPPVWQVEVDPE
jgi:hypothetical protein